MIAVRACVVLAVLTGLAAADEVGGLRPARRPNVLVLVSDDQRPDTIAALGNPAIRTPHLDRLVRAGTAFLCATCANPICTPSRAEILTGCDSFRNGAMDFGRPIDPQLPLWPQTMRAAGYRTWYVGKWHNDGRPIQRGYQRSRGLFAGGGGKWPPTVAVDWKGMPVTGYRGWVFQDDEGNKFPELGVGLTPDIDRRFADAAIALIEQPSEEPFFLHVNFTTPHDPLLVPPGDENRYDPQQIPLPENFRPEHPFDHGNLRGRDELLFSFPRTEQQTRAALAVYYARISYMDEQIGRILDALRRTGQWENTLVVFTSDHGLAIGSHGLRGKQNMYEHTIRVPLILAGPGVPRGRRTEALCYLRDLYPTVCELAGIAVPASVQGRSLRPVLDGTADGVRNEVFGCFRDSQRMIRTAEWKLIEYPQSGRRQLFDLTRDPDELTDRSADPACANVRDRLAARLRAWQQQAGDPLVRQGG